MNKVELNMFAIAYAKKAFQKQGFSIEKSPAALGEVNFLAVPGKGTPKKIKVRSAGQIPNYIFVTKNKFNIDDNDLYMAVVYVSGESEEPILYVIPATEWGKGIYPFKGRDYDKPGLSSDAEWGINLSQKTIDAMESYRGLQKVIP